MTERTNKRFEDIEEEISQLEVDGKIFSIHTCSSKSSTSGKFVCVYTGDYTGLYGAFPDPKSLTMLKQCISLISETAKRVPITFH
jgi:hypothetical protein